MPVDFNKRSLPFTNIFSLSFISYSVFAGLSILCNLLLMISWTPAALAFYARNCEGMCCGRGLATSRSTSPLPQQQQSSASATPLSGGGPLTMGTINSAAAPPNGQKEKSFVIIENMKNSVKTITNIPKAFFEKALPQAIVRTRFVWVVFLGSLIMGAILTVFYHPKLKLPNKEQFQLFRVSSVSCD